MDNGNEPATKADIQALTAKVETLATDVETLKIDVRKMRTEVLGTVYRLAESGQIRVTDAECVASAIKERLALVEDRLLDVEMPLDMPPRA